MKINTILDELYSKNQHEIKLGLDSITTLLKKIGNPHKNLKCIHVAGTNGKGSVCAMLHSILVGAGYKTGLYTSPHLKKFNERIRINNQLISNKEIVRLYKKIKKHVTTQSFFEITTALAFLYFKEKKVDIVILETGLGGRLDATNVVTPLVSVITNIGYEHTNILGKTLNRIAYEKAGIIKNKIPVVTAATGIALAEIKKAANKKKAPLSVIDDKKIKTMFVKKNNTWLFDYSQKKFYLKKLRGKYQTINASICLQVIDILIGAYKYRINHEQTKKGIEQTSWKARLEVRKNILIDCAHNPSAFIQLFAELEKWNYKRLIIILGFSDDKNIKKISSLVNSHADIIILTQSKNTRAASITSIAPYFSLPILIENPNNAIQYAKKIKQKGDLIVIAGSIYMIGEIN